MAAVVILLHAGCDRPHAPTTSGEPAPDPSRPPSAEIVRDGMRISPELAAELAAIETREAAAENGVWADEIAADRHGRVIERFWNGLNASPRRMDALTRLDFTDLLVAADHRTNDLGRGIHEILPGSQPPIRWAPEAWRNLVESAAAAGWLLEHVELRHRRFDPATTSAPATSIVQVYAQLTNTRNGQRATLDGPVHLTWSSNTDVETAPPVIDRIDASPLRRLARLSAPGFETVLEEAVPPQRHSQSVDPLIVHDLDGDGRSELVLVGANRVYRHTPAGQYRSEPLFPAGYTPAEAAVLADFDGDGRADLLLARTGALEFAHGDPDGHFAPPRPSGWPGSTSLRNPQALAAGDVDHDGDLDVFLAQYRTPYEGGSLPTPFHDARDGHPSFLLLNDGRARFTDATRGSGLEAKRSRRTYGASFVDLDADGNLDLVVTSDFAGVDHHRGDGRGGFRDATSDWLPESHLFGMSHVFSDFDRNGSLDLLALGMTSSTASRLDHRKAWRPTPSGQAEQRTTMTRGSRLYLASSNSNGFRFGTSPLDDSIADTGWAWGATDIDVDLDGYPDVHVTTGHETRASVRDYDREYWLHDMYVGSSEEAAAPYLYFRGKFARTRGRGESYGGHERNRLYLNLRGERFVEVGHLFGLGLAADSRNTVSDDLDGDGRPDLIVVHAERWPGTRQFLHIYRNALPQHGHWLRLRFPEGPDAKSMGARISLRQGPVDSARAWVTGTSYRSQHPPSVLFGLGPNVSSNDLRLRIRWPDGGETTVDRPAPDQVLEARRR